MNSEIFSVYDAAATRYLEPFVAPTVDFAIRSFGEACSTEGHQFNKFPEDYILYHIGEFDGVSGNLKEALPRKVANALQFRVTDQPIALEG